MFAIPNGGKRHIGTAVKLKREGVKAGVPDIFLPYSMNHSCWIYHGLFIELKRLKPRGKTTPEQIEWIDALHKEHYAVHVCWGWESARDVIVDYLRRAWDE